MNETFPQSSEESTPLPAEMERMLALACKTALGKSTTVQELQKTLIPSLIRLFHQLTTSHQDMMKRPSSPSGAEMQQQKELDERAKRANRIAASKKKILETLQNPAKKPMLDKTYPSIEIGEPELTALAEIDVDMRIIGPRKNVVVLALLLKAKEPLSDDELARISGYTEIPSAISHCNRFLPPGWTIEGSAKCRSIKMQKSLNK